MAKLLPFERSMMRALAAGGLVIFLLVQSLVVAGAGRGLASGVGFAAAEPFCHPGPDGGEERPAAPRPHAHCALCPCLSSGPALDAALAVAILVLAPPAALAPPRAGPRAAPPPRSGAAGAWSSRAPPLG